MAATYTRDSTFNGSISAAVPPQVNESATTTTTITFDSPDPSVVGQSVTVQYSVTSGSGTRTGDVTVSDGTISCTDTMEKSSEGPATTDRFPGQLAARSAVFDHIEWFYNCQRLYSTLGYRRPIAYEHQR